MTKLPFLLALILLAFSVAQPVSATPDAQIQNDSSYLDSLGFLHIVGEVKNTGDVWLEFIRISATLKAQNGSILDISFTYTYLDRLPPSETAGFDVLEVNAAKSAATDSYSLSLEFHESASRTVRLQIINVGTSRNVFQWLEILGEVQNNGDSVSEYTMVIGTFYGTDGKVVEVGFTYTDPSTIQPGAKQAFKLSVTGEDRSNLVSTYSLAAESMQYTSIPELPWQSILIAGIVLSATVIVLRRRTRCSTRDANCKSSPPSLPWSCHVAT